MNDDDIPEGKPVVLNPTTKFGWLVVTIEKKGWVKRQLPKLGALVASYLTGLLMSHGGQDYAKEIGMGAAAAVMYFGEMIWSYLVFKAGHVKINDALNMPSVQQVNKPEWLKLPS